MRFILLIDTRLLLDQGKIKYLLVAVSLYILLLTHILIILLILVVFVTLLFVAILFVRSLSVNC
jgi:hypothetical protein